MKEFLKIKSVKLGEPCYPARLAQIFDPPGELFYVGDLEVLKKPLLAIVGSRRATPYGREQSFQIAKDLSLHGICIVSGLAYGIDEEAHKGALEGAGGTVAVVAQDLSNIMPTRNVGLAERIVGSGGLLISENPGRPVLKHEYLVRNRIISGLSLGVLIVEAANRSGALNTARHALEQNRDVMAVPGRVTDEQSAGTNKLLAGGAGFITCAKDVAEILALEWGVFENIDLSLEEREIFEIIKAEPLSAAELGERFEGQLKALYEGLGKLELKGMIRRRTDMRYSAGY